MEVKAIAKYVRVQPRKVRIIADEVRGKSAVHTVSLLRYHTGKGAQALHQVLVSAMANAQENHNLSPDQLKIAAITVDEGPRLKRMQARAMGRGNRIIKKTSHITVVVEDYEAPKPVKPHGTKAKPRPTFAAPSKGKKKAAPAGVSEAAVEAPVSEEISTTETAVEAPTIESTHSEPAGTDEKGAE
jgi:large subunit ribosomal protein L22